MTNKEIDNLRYRIVNRYVGCLRDIEVDSRLRERLTWSDNNKIIGQIAYSIHNIADFTDEAFRSFDDVENYEAFILRELAGHAKNVENNILPELERVRLDTRWLSGYYEELADVKKVLDEFNVV
ncbi:hypothetical protein [Leuconostoc mesenteroides]|jgi:hypothetical protein|uniref:hypothetical protein n=1 Tax=Leuconostoc mesenteroides TaxID=1245 RepID=UPI000680861B|nr:hypothetical protein [Leuconostoc mesenteroides]KMY76859.1 hypothetical protein WZ79_10255 [Leuconostoc mesenteroides subsp. mesenteroides]MCT3049850.1 hypothetical protein [Leuconostoc mesenteroides]RDF89050.1 hypothetical protein DQM09_09795 [Leuconostoc mesenteroides subsp. mesenteroides]